MNSLEARGFARLAGALDGCEDVRLIIRAESSDAIERQLAVNPWTQSEILSTIRIERWNLRLGQVS
jgi:uncharacterized protein YciI